MKSILMTTSAVFLVTGFAAGQAQAACPEDIDAFDREYQQTLQNVAAGEALSASEQAQLFGLRTAAENLHQAGNAEMCAEVVERANLILESAIAPQVIRPDELIGREVTNAQEENLGEIENVMLDPVSGRIAYVVVEHGGFLGIGDDLFAVPWRAMQFVPGNDQTLLLDVPEEKLENAPRFSPEDESPLERREWVTAVHSYYGVQPYWQDDLGAMAMQYGGGATPAAAGGGATGSQQGAEGEVKTIVVPITEPETEAQPEGTEAQPEQESGADTPSGAPSDSQSAAEPQSGAASLIAARPPSDNAEKVSADVQALSTRMDKLEQQVQELSQKDIGAEVEQSIASLEQQVQKLSEQMPGEEVTQAIDRLEKQVAALGETAGESPDQSSGASEGAGRAAAVVVVPEQSGQNSQNGGQGGQQQGDQSGQPPASGQSRAAAPSDPGPQSGQPSQTSDQQGQAGEQQGQAGQQMAAQGATSGATPTAGKPCGEQITLLEEELKRAEKLGVATEDAQSELGEAQAMLKNNSEALCRAAIKRAHEKLAAVGFESKQTN